MSATKPTASSSAPARPTNGKLNLDPARLLATPLNSKLLDINLDADVYARNGFRFAGVTAAADERALEQAVQQFRNRFALDPALAAKSYLRLGYDDHLRLDAEDIRESVSQLNNPRQRIVAELFWPHLPDELFRQLAHSRQLAPAEALPLLTQMAVGKGLGSVLTRHALAVMEHNLALAQELEFVAGRSGHSDEHWAAALNYWAEALNADIFWDYLGERVLTFDDPRLTPADTLLLRGQMPGVVLGFNILLAQLYDRAGDAEACARHIRLINQCRLPEAAKQATFQSLANTLAETRLGSLVRQVEENLLALEDETLNRQKFDAKCAPILNAAGELPGLLENTLSLPPKVVAACRFDTLTEKLLRALNRKIDYGTEDRTRSLLYSLLVTKRMLALPLSAEMRQQLEHARRSDIEHLYKEFAPAKDFDPTQCWFLPGQETDPDASFEFPLYKITDVKGAGIRWQNRRIMVPRSKLARELQGMNNNAGSGCLGGLAGAAVFCLALFAIDVASFFWYLPAIILGAGLGFKAVSLLNARRREAAAQELIAGTGRKEVLLALLKPETDKHDFPAYRQAKKAGYKDGKEPSDAEVSELVQREVRNMMDSLDPTNRLLLAKIISEGSGAESSRLLANLMEMSPSERNRVLRDLFYELLKRR